MCIIKKLRKEKGMSQKDLAGLLHVNQTAVSQWERGTTTPTKLSLIALSNIFEVSTDYLLGISEGTVKPYIRIPVLGRVPAGTPIETNEDIIGYVDVSIETISEDKEYFALKLKGNSMSPKYLDGDIVIVQQQSTCESGQDAVIMVDGEDATFKKVLIKENSIILQPINHAYEPLFFSAKEIEELPVVILGIVIEIRRTV